MGMPDCEGYTNLTIADGWQHCFTFPREIYVKDGVICQCPIRELEARKHDHNITILTDISSVGVFVNDGEYVFSTRYYPEEYGILVQAKDAEITLARIS